MQKANDLKSIDLRIDDFGGSEDQLSEFLEMNAEEIYPAYEFERELTDIEIADRKDRLAEVNIELARLRSEKDRKMNEFKAKMAPKEEDIKIIVGSLARGTHIEQERCYRFVDHENKESVIYNSSGKCIERRPLNESERQISIMTAINEEE